MSKMLFDKVIRLELYKYSTKPKDVFGSPIGGFSGLVNIAEGVQRFVQTKVGATYEQKLVLEEKYYGMKPDISLKVNMIPGQNCYGCTVTIRNLAYLVDVRELAYMKITAGYRMGDTLSNDKTITINSPIFSAYQESPNPDGTTVLQGLVAGSIGTLFTPHMINLKIYEELTVREFLEACTLGAAGYRDKAEYATASKNDGTGALIVNINLPEGLANIKVPAPVLSTFGNGYALLQEAYNLVKGLVANPSNEKIKGGTLIMQIFNNSVYFGLLEEGGTFTSAEKITPITHITTASFTGPVLNLTAPWNPEIIPGGIVKVSANYFTGQNVPNTLDIMSAAQDNSFVSPADRASGKGLYRVITVDIAFDTCGATNEMKLLLVPYNMASENDVDKSRLNMSYQALKESLEKIRFTSSMDVVRGKEEIDKDANPILKLSLVGSYTTNSKDRLIEEGDDLSSIARDEYVKISDASDWFSLKKSEFKKDIVKDIDSTGKIIMGKSDDLIWGLSVSRAYFWPLILIHTYGKQKVLESAKQPSPYNINKNEPDSIVIGTYVSVPALPQTSAQIKAQVGPDKEVFKTMADYYIKNMYKWNTTKEDIINLYNIYIGLGGELK